jgi:hypothetical protein
MLFDDVVAESGSVRLASRHDTPPPSGMTERARPQGRALPPDRHRPEP